jgi:hypothetical protein
MTNHGIWQCLPATQEAEKWTTQRSSLKATSDAFGEFAKAG